MKNCHFSFVNLIVGVLATTSMMVLWLHTNLHLALALSCLVAASAGVAIADVTIDACVTQCSISHPTLAADLQSLCGLSSSIGSLVGFSLSGVLVHWFGAKVGSFSLTEFRREMWFQSNALSAPFLAGCVWFTLFDCRIGCCGWDASERISYSESRSQACTFSLLFRSNNVSQSSYCYLIE